METEYLVVVHCRLPLAALEPAVDPLNSPAAEGKADDGTNDESSSTAVPEPPTNVLAAAISAHVYTLPTGDGVPAASIVYISKVDSSGYAASAGPVTRELAIGVLSHFLSPATRPTPRVTATLFARSQGQYLFPNSVEGGGKRVLGGLGLCQWWKGVYESAAEALVTAGVKTSDLHLRYLLPSYSASEASGMLRAPIRAPPVEWEYKPPFTHPLLPTDTPSLATLLPSLPDDPKTRFLEELVDAAVDRVTAPIGPTTSSSSAASTSNATALGPTTSSSSIVSTASSTRKHKHNDRERIRAEAEDEEERRRAHAALSRVPADEFWERIGFRQECASGDVTGFFSISVETEGETAANHFAAKTNGASTRTAIPQLLVERLLKSLLNTDFGTRALACAGTVHWLESTHALVADEIGEDGWTACVANVGAKEGVERVVKRKEEVVTMLQPRKKKK